MSFVRQWPSACCLLVWNSNRACSHVQRVAHIGVRWGQETHLKEEPLLEGSVLGLQHTLIQHHEAVQHPCLLKVCQVLYG